MDKKYLAIGALLFVVFVGGLIFLSRSETAVTGDSGKRFETYAEQIGLDMDQFRSDFLSEEVKQAVDRNLKEGVAREVTSTPTFFINGEKVSLTSSAQEIKEIVDPLVESSDVVLAIPEGAHYKGSDRPTVIIEEFSDLQCPACGSYEPALNEYMTDNDQPVAFVYKHFPLSSIHAFAQEAAQATEAAAKQGKFWEMHDILFEEQVNWSR